MVQQSRPASTVLKTRRHQRKRILTSLLRKTGSSAVLASILFMTAGGIRSTAGTEPTSPPLAQDVNSLPVTQTGQANVVLETSWDPSDATLDPGTVRAPEGWIIEYSEDGSTWTTTEPVDTTSVETVRASGTVPSQGDGGEDNTLRVSELSANVTGSPLEFAASNGGDGYDVAFPDADRVINVYHHNGPGRQFPVTFDCKLRSTGDACPEGQIVFDDDPNQVGPGPYITPNNSRVAVHRLSRKAYTPVVRRADWALGFLCVDYSLATPAPCAPEFIKVSTQSVIDDRPNWAGAHLDIGGAAFDDDRFFVVNGINHRLYCLDMADAAVCDGFEERVVSGSTVDGFQLPPNSAEGPTGPNSGAWGYSSDISVIDGRVYFFQGNRPNNSTFGCVDPIAGGYCQSSTPTVVPGEPFDFPPFPLFGTDGSLQGVCLILHRSCIDSASSTSLTMPAALNSFLDPATAGGITAYTFYATYVSLVEWGLKSSRLFVPVEAGGSSIGSFWPSDLACWDFESGTPCDFGSNGFEPGIMRDVSPGLNLYSFSADPYVDCIWSNSDSGHIISMGTDGGKCGGDDSASVFAFDEDDARLDCDASGDPIRWTELNLTLPEGLLLTSLRLTVRDANGDVVSGWDDLPIADSIVDLSNLDIDDTGPSPTFDVTFANTGLDVATEVTAELQYVTPPPELCLNLIPITECTLGQAVNGRLPAPPFDITHSNVLSIGANTTPTTKTSALTGAMYEAQAQCGLGALEGTTTRIADGTPLSGATVTLRHPTTRAVLATTSTDSSGNFRFDNLTPGTYVVEFANVDGYSATPDSATSSPTIIVGETSRADGVYQQTGDDRQMHLGLLEGLLLPDTA